MTRIRLQRKGRKNRPFFHILVMNQRTKRDGKFIDHLGTYDPIMKTERRVEKIKIDHDKYKEWIIKGAQPSETVAKLVSLIGKDSEFKAKKDAPLKTS